MISVACDICGRRHSLTNDRWEQRIHCRDCGVIFDVDEHNEFDPTVPEDAEKEIMEEEEQESLFSKVWGTAIHVVGTVCVVVALTWMVGLVFADPRATGPKPVVQSPPPSPPSTWTPPPRPVNPMPVNPVPSVPVFPAPTNPVANLELPQPTVAHTPSPFGSTLPGFPSVNPNSSMPSSPSFPPATSPFPSSGAHSAPSRNPFAESQKRIEESRKQMDEMQKRNRDAMGRGRPVGPRGMGGMRP